MDRRNFVRLGLASAVTGMVLPKVAFAKSSTMAGGLYYTKDKPGRWHKKVGGHLPNIEVSKKGKKVSIHVVTAHEMKGYEHYIIKHVVLDKDFKFIAEKMFNPEVDQLAVSDFDLGKYKGKVNVLSVCNKHDTWLNTVKV